MRHSPRSASPSKLPRGGFPLWASVLCGAFLLLLLYALADLLAAPPASQQAVWLSFLAGISTTVGAGVVLLGPVTPSILAFTSGMAGSVMVTISLLDMLLPAIWSPEVGGLSALALFFLGAALFRLLSRAYSSLEPHLSAFISVPPGSSGSHSGSALPSPPGIKTEDRMMSSSRLLRVGVLTAITLTAHNLPEGLAVLVSALDSSQHGMAMAVAVALHNIPEGLAIATPVFAATGSAWQALLWTTVSGMSEPVGAVISLAYLRGVVSPRAVEWILCMVGGVMTAVAVVELIPEGMSYPGRQHQALAGAVSGFLLVVGDLLLFRFV